MLSLFRKSQSNRRLEIASVNTRVTSKAHTSQRDELGMGLGLAKVESTVRHSRGEQTIGRVKFEGVSWQALCIRDVACMPGTLVSVKYRHGITLIVDLPSEEKCSPYNVS